MKGYYDDDDLALRQKRISFLVSSVTYMSRFTVNFMFFGSYDSGT